ncbi:MAG: PASTA domain-containing protein [Dehalococcoidia bacterium]|nr:PASTA domain-containing protein [Dehalococcoidia bacterium]
MAREEQGRTLEEVQESTKVRKSFLDALEREDFASLPPRIYAIGIIRKYAKYLDTDPGPLVALLPDDKDINPTLVPLPTVGGAPRPWGTRIITGLIIFILIGILGARMSQVSDSSAKSYQGVVVAEIPTAVAARPGDTAKSNGLAVILPTSTPFPTATPAPKPSPAPKLRVPSLTGAQEETARTRLQSMGLVMNVEEAWSDSSPAGVLLDQKPSPGQELAKGEFVFVVVSKGPDTRIGVPNVIGMPEKQAQQVLAQAKLINSPWANYQGLEQIPASVLSSVCIGCVLSITPGPGQLVEKGATISMAVRRE